MIDTANNNRENNAGKLVATGHILTFTGADKAAKEEKAEKGSLLLLKTILHGVERSEPDRSAFYEGCLNYYDIFV